MRVVIVGVAARAFEWDDDDEVWFINRAAVMYTTKLDEWQGFRHPPRWFHLHGPEHILAAEGPGQIESLKAVAAAGTYRVYMPKAYYPGVIPFPYDQVIADTQAHIQKLHSSGEPYSVDRGLFGVPHLHNSFPLLIAFAILEGATHIVMDGVQFGPDKPAEQWAVPAIEWQLGRAAGKGIKVSVPLGSGLMEPHHIYGLEGPGCV